MCLKALKDINVLTTVSNYWWRIMMYRMEITLCFPIKTSVTSVWCTLCVPVSTSSHRSRGRGSPDQVWTPVWALDSHPAGTRSFDRCNHNPSSRSTCRMSHPLKSSYTSDSQKVLTCTPVHLCLTSLPLWREAECPTARKSNPPLTGRPAVSWDTACDTQFVRNQEEFEWDWVNSHCNENETYWDIHRLQTNDE